MEMTRSAPQESINSTVLRRARIAAVRGDQEQHEHER
jgi:hypothetical protein